MVGSLSVAGTTTTRVPHEIAELILPQETCGHWGKPLHALVCLTLELIPNTVFNNVYIVISNFIMKATFTV